MRFLFITGSHKSGTSWLAMMLSDHPKIGIPGQELWLMGQQNTLAERIAAAVDGWLELPTVNRQFDTEQTAEQARRRIARAALRGAIDAALGGVDGLDYIGDKTPVFYAREHVRLRQLFPDAKCIHILRDPRDVIASHHFHAYRLDEWQFFGDPDRAQAVAQRIRAGEDVGRDLLDAHATEQLARRWSEVQAAGLSAQAAAPDAHVLCRYEDFLTDPAGNLARLFGFLGVPAGDGMVRDIVDRRSFAALTGGRKPGETDASSFFRKGIAGDWRNHFTPEAEDIVTGFAGPLMERFGYPAGD